MNKNYTSYRDYCGIESIPRLLGDKELQLCAMQGQVFTMAREMEIPISGFAEVFMSCPMGALFDGACDDQTCVDILRVLAPAPKDTVTAVLTMKREYVESSGLLDAVEPYTAEYAYWLGFIYRYQQCRRCLPSSFILERFPPALMRKAYEVLKETGSFILPGDAVRICMFLDERQ